MTISPKNLQLTLMRSIRFIFVFLSLTYLSVQGQTFLADLPIPNGIVHVVKYDVFNQRVYIGGEFTEVDGQSRNHLASVDLINGTLTSWNPNVNGVVYSMQISSDTLYVGGDFGMAGSLIRNNLCAFALADGDPTAWNPNANGTVRTVDVGGSQVYVGGEFTSIGGVPMERVGAVLKSGIGSPSTCIPANCDGIVHSLRVHGSVFWLGGEFSSISGSSRGHIAALNANSCNTTSWNPSSDGHIFSVDAGSGTEVWVGGSFTNIGGQLRQGFAEIDRTTGNATDWNANCNGVGRSIAANSWLLFLGGEFDELGGQPRNGLAAVRLSDASLVDWDPELENNGAPVVVNSISTRGPGIDPVFVGGDFQTVGGTYHPYFAAWSGTFTNVADISQDLPVLPLYPNPSGGIIHIDAHWNGGHYLVIENSVGQRIRRFHYSPMIDVSEVSPGIYVVRLFNGQDLPVAQARLVIE